MTRATTETENIELPMLRSRNLGVRKKIGREEMESSLRRYG